ncbi:hypothetical protein BaRGS_00009959, partial [Batillaria attramentaria]
MIYGSEIPGWGREKTENLFKSGVKRYDLWDEAPLVSSWSNSRGADPAVQRGDNRVAICQRP